jgi:hypothetical protein
MEPGRPAYASGEFTHGTTEEEAAAAAGYLAYSGPFYVDAQTATLKHPRPSLNRLSNAGPGTCVARAKRERSWRSRRRWCVSLRVAATHGPDKRLAHRWVLRDTLRVLNNDLTSQHQTITQSASLHVAKAA